MNPILQRYYELKSIKRSSYVESFMRGLNVSDAKMDYYLSEKNRGKLVDSLINIAINGPLHSGEGADDFGDVWGHEHQFTSVIASKGKLGTALNEKGMKLLAAVVGYNDSALALEFVVLKSKVSISSRSQGCVRCGGPGYICPHCGKIYEHRYK